MVTTRAHTAITADLKAPAFHPHDEVQVPMQVISSLRRDRWDKTDASIIWVTTYACPQCGETFRVESHVDLSAETNTESDFAWHHGEGPA